MALEFTSAVNAYQRAAKTTDSMVSGKIDAAAGAANTGSFLGMVNDSLKSAVTTGREAEELSLKQISGEADLKDVVTAVANAEHTLETVVAVRDKVLNAYQEILRMPI
jgi:flagellar hook-basal body complex protein FliE